MSYEHVLFDVSGIIGRAIVGDDDFNLFEVPA